MRKLIKAWASFHYRNVYKLKKKAELGESAVPADVLMYGAKYNMAWFEFVTIGRPKLREEIIRENRHLK